MRIYFSLQFQKDLKKLAKKYRSILLDVENLLVKLTENPTLGTALGKDCYKIRLAVSSKRKGKRGGTRVISYAKIVQDHLVLLTIYDKSEKSDITDKELQALLDATESNQEQESEKN